MSSDLYKLSCVQSTGSQNRRDQQDDQIPRNADELYIFQRLVLLKFCSLLMRQFI